MKISHLIGILMFSIIHDAHSQSTECSNQDYQLVYTSEQGEPYLTKSYFELGDKLLEFVDNESNKPISVKRKDVSLILDKDEKDPSFRAFDKKGKVYCSKEYGVLNFPLQYSYAGITKDHEIILAGVSPSSPVDPETLTRNLVNDNTNRIEIDMILKDNLVLECFTNDRGLNKFIFIHVPATQLDLYKDEIIELMEKTMDEFGTIPHDHQQENEMSAIFKKDSPAEEDDSEESLSKSEPNLEDETTLSELNSEVDKKDETESTKSSLDLLSSPTNLGKRSVPKDEISERDKDEVQLQAEEKLYQLNDAFAKLVSREYTGSQKERIRKSTVEELFVSDESVVQVSSTSSDVLDNYTIAEYLFRLESILPAVYQKVEIEFAEINKVSNFVKQPDGTWRAIIVFSQIFKGYKNLDGSGPTYADITQKNVEVVVKRSELYTGGSSPELYWEVLLDDIGVNQTKSF